jgi:uncharacterized membrane protein YeaQ/YmgE (transglycosylase-associated protein family)
MFLEPGGIIAWLIVGLVAGFLAGVVMKGSGYGVVGDIVMGIIGAFVGGIIASLLGFGGSTGLIGMLPRPAALPPTREGQRRAR